MFKNKKSNFIAIYVVDDAFLVRKSIYEYLYKKPKDTNFGVAYDFIGESALKREFKDQLPSQKADLFFIDMDLPDGTAWDLIEQVYLYHPQAQIIAMTDENSIETQQLRLQYEDQVVAVLEKPFQPNHLYEVFEQAIKERFNIKSEPVQATQPKSERTRIYFEDELAQQDNHIATVLPHANETITEPESMSWSFEAKDRDNQTAPFMSEQDDLAPSLEWEFTHESISEKKDSTNDLFNFEWEDSSFEQAKDIETNLSFETNKQTAVMESPNLSLASDKIETALKDEKPNSSIFLMEDVYDDDEFSDVSPKTSTIKIIDASSNKKEIKKEDCLIKNEENEDFNEFLSEEEANKPHLEEKNPLNEEMNICKNSLEEKNLLNEGITDNFSLDFNLEEINAKNEDKKHSNLPIFEFTTTEINEPTESIFEFSLGDSTSTADPDFDFDLSFETASTTKNIENDSFNLEFHLDSKLENEYFQEPSSYTEKSQPQTEELFFFDEITAETPVDSAQSSMEEIPTNLSFQSTSSPVQSSNSDSKDFVISPPRSKGPGVPTTPKEFGRFGIRK